MIFVFVSSRSFVDVAIYFFEVGTLMAFALEKSNPSSSPWSVCRGGSRAGLWGLSGQQPFPGYLMEFTGCSSGLQFQKLHFISSSKVIRKSATQGHGTPIFKATLLVYTEQKRTSVFFRMELVSSQEGNPHKNRTGVLLCNWYSPSRGTQAFLFNFGWDRLRDCQCHQKVLQSNRPHSYEKAAARQLTCQLATQCALSGGGQGAANVIPFPCSPSGHPSAVLEMQSHSPPA